MYIINKLMNLYIGMEYIYSSNFQCVCEELNYTALEKTKRPVQIFLKSASLWQPFYFGVC